MNPKTRIVRGILAAVAALGIVTTSLVASTAAYAADLDTVTLTTPTTTIGSNNPVTYTLGVSCGTTGGCTGTTVTIPTTTITGNGSVTDFSSWFTNSGGCPAMTTSAGQVSFAYGSLASGSFSTCTITLRAPDKTTLNGAQITVAPTISDNAGSVTGASSSLSFTAAHNGGFSASPATSYNVGQPVAMNITFGCGNNPPQSDIGEASIHIVYNLPSNMTFTGLSTQPAQTNLHGTLTVPAVGTVGGTITYDSTDGADCLSPSSDRLVFIVSGNSEVGGVSDPPSTPGDASTQLCQDATATWTYIDAPTATPSTLNASSCITLNAVDYGASKGAVGATIGQEVAPGGSVLNYTYPGDWDGTGGDTYYNIQAYTLPRQATNGGLEYDISDPLPCLDNQAGSVISSNAPGVACAHPAFVPTVVTASGFTPPAGSKLNLIYANGTTGTSNAYSSGWTIPASPVVSEIDFPAFASEGSNTLTAILFRVNGYVVANAPVNTILRNTETTKAQFVSTGAFVDATGKTAIANLLVADPNAAKTAVVSPGLSNSVNAATCTQNVLMSGQSQIQIPSGPSKAIYLDFLAPPGVTQSMIGGGGVQNLGLQLVTNAAIKQQATGVVPTFTSNYNGTGRLLVEWVIPAGLVSAGGDYYIIGSNFAMGLPKGCDGRYLMSLTVGYGDPIQACGSPRGAVPPVVPSGDPQLTSNGSPITGNYCGTANAFIITQNGAKYVVDKSVQGNLDSSPINGGGIGKVTPTGGTATYTVSFTNTGAINLHDPVMYDILPTATSDAYATTGASRGSAFGVALTAVPTPQSGLPGTISIEYSTSPNPCRPEVFPTDTGCTNDWTSTVPADLSTVTALRFEYNGTVGVSGGSFATSISVSYPVSTPNTAVGNDAWNSVGATARSGDTGDGLADDPDLGASESSLTGLTASTNSPAIVKSASQSTYSTVGEGIHFDFDVTNTEEVALTGVTVSDTFTDAPTGEDAPTVTCAELSNPDASCSGSSTPLAPGQVAHFVASYNVTQADLDHGVLSDSALVSASAEGAPISNTSNTVTLTADVTRGLTLVKSSPTASYANVGDEVDYNFLLTNTGTQTLDGLSVDDSLVPGVTCPVNMLGPGASTTCTGTYAATQADIDAGSIVNTATASAVGPQNQTVTTGESSVTVDAVQSPAITLTKSATQASIAHVGDPITFHFAVANSGNVTLDNVAVAEGTFTGTGTLSAVDCPDTTLAPTDTMDCTADYTATQKDLDSGSVSNTASVSGETPQDVVVGSDPSTVSVPVATDATLTLTKTADVTKITSVGQIVTYSFEIKNTGNVTVTDVIVQEGHFTGTGTLSAIDCPAGVSSMAPGDDLTCSATYAVTAADLKSGELSNTAVASGSDGATTVASADSTAAVTSDPPAKVPPVLGTTGVDIDGGLWLAVGLLGLGALAFLLRRRRRNA